MSNHYNLQPVSCRVVVTCACAHLPASPVRTRNAVEDFIELLKRQHILEQDDDPRSSCDSWLACPSVGNRQKNPAHYSNGKGLLVWSLKSELNWTFYYFVFFKYVTLFVTELPHRIRNHASLSLRLSGVTTLVNKLDVLLWTLGLETDLGNRQKSLEAYGRRVISCLSDQGIFFAKMSAWQCGDMMSFFGCVSQFRKFARAPFHTAIPCWNQTKKQQGTEMGACRSFPSQRVWFMPRCLQWHQTGGPYGKSAGEPTSNCGQCTEFEDGAFIHWGRRWSVTAATAPTVPWCVHFRLRFFWCVVCTVSHKRNSHAMPNHRYYRHGQGQCRQCSVWCNQRNENNQKANGSWNYSQMHSPSQASNTFPITLSAACWNLYPSSLLLIVLVVVVCICILISWLCNLFVFCGAMIFYSDFSS